MSQDRLSPVTGVIVFANKHQQGDQIGRIFHLLGDHFLCEVFNVSEECGLKMTTFSIREKVRL
jgi:hypothetical protein